jgi:hypothetical protein
LAHLQDAAEGYRLPLGGKGLHLCCLALCLHSFLLAEIVKMGVVNG